MPPVVPPRHFLTCSSLFRFLTSPHLIFSKSLPAQSYQGFQELYSLPLCICEESEENSPSSSRLLTFPHFTPHIAVWSSASSLRPNRKQCFIFRLCYPATEVFNVKPRRFLIIPDGCTRADLVVHGPTADQVRTCNVIIGKFCAVTEFRCQL